MKKIITILLMVLPGICAAQKVTYTKVSYTFFSLDSAKVSWERQLITPLVVTIDTAGKKIIIPRLEVTEWMCNRRDIVRNIYSTLKDTSIIVQNWNEALNIAGYKKVDENVKAVYFFRDGSTALDILGHLIITYPAVNNIIRCIDFKL